MSTSTGDERLLYLYCIVAGERRVPRVAGAALKSVSGSGLSAIVESVAWDEYSHNSAEGQHHSLDWISELALKHHAVVEAAIAHRPAIPARLCTLFSDEAAVRACLAENESGYRELLARVGGCREWGLKVLCNEGVVRSACSSADALVRELTMTAAKSSPGHAYLLARRREARCADLTADRIDEVTDHVLDRIERLRVEIRLKSLSLQQDMEYADKMVLNMAILVKPCVKRSFLVAVEQMANAFLREGFTFEVTGPWAPYAFCDAEPGERSGSSGENSEQP